jgi:hypothetical protein
MIPPNTTPPLPDPGNALAASGPAGAVSGQVSAFDGAGAPSGTALGSPGALGERMMGTLEGFQSDAAHMQGVTQAMLTPGASAPSEAGAATDPGAVSPAGQAGASAHAPADTQNSLGLIVETFNFALETQLVARAANQFTGSVSTLMKGQ